MKLAEWAKLPAALIGVAVAMVTIAGAVVRFTGMPARFDAHVAAARLEHAGYRREDSVIHTYRQQMARLQAQMWRERSTEQCLENEYRMLARQVLLRVCDSLGIDRRAGDVPPATMP